MITFMLKRPVNGVMGEWWTPAPVWGSGRGFNKQWRAGWEEEGDRRSSSLAVTAAASTSLFYLRWVTLHLWVFQFDGSAELSSSPLSAFHVLNPHSCSLCVTSSHSLAFFNRLSLSIKPPPPSSPSSSGSNQMSKSVGELNPNVSGILSQRHENQAAMTCWSQLKGKVSSPLMCTITDAPSFLQAVWYWLFDGTIGLIPPCQVRGTICKVSGSQWHFLH